MAKIAAAINLSDGNPERYIVSTAAARSDDRPDSLIRFARLAPDNERCPAARN